MATCHMARSAVGAIMDKASTAPATGAADVTFEGVKDVENETPKTSKDWDVKPVDRGGLREFPTQHGSRRRPGENAVF